MPFPLDPMKKFLGLSPEEAAMAPSIFAPNQAPDLTGYFHQLNTSRNPVEIPGITDRVNAEQKRQEASQQAQFEENDPAMKAHSAAELQDKLALASEPNRMAGQMTGQNAAAADARKAEALKSVLGMVNAPTPETAGSTSPRFKMNINANMEPSFTETPPKPLNAAEEDAIQAMAKAQPIISGLRETLKPGGNQAMSWLWNNATNKAYNAGISTDPTQEKKIQLSGLLSVVGSMPYAGRSRSFQMIQQAMKHLTQPGQSDVMMSHQLDEIEKLWPQMQQEIIQAHQTPGAALDTVGADAYANPNYQPK